MRMNHLGVVNRGVKSNSTKRTKKNQQPAGQEESVICRTVEQAELQFDKLRQMCT